jgi:hypothetical protein
MMHFADSNVKSAKRAPSKKPARENSSLRRVSKEKLKAITLVVKIANNSTGFAQYIAG